MDLPARTGPEGVVFVNMSSLLEDLTTAYKVQERPPDSVTARELAASTGRTFNFCNTLLGKLAERGELESDYFPINGKRTRVYWKKEATI